MKSDQVLEEYRKGNADKRMSLFLYHRELRDAFGRIEQDDPLELFAVRKEPLRAEQGSFCAYIGRLREHLGRPRSRASFDRIEK